MAQLYLNGNPRSEVIKEYDLSESTFDRWVKQSHSTGSFRQDHLERAHQNEAAGQYA